MTFYKPLNIQESVVSPCSHFGITAGFQCAFEGKNMHRYGWKQWDGEMPKGDLQSGMNDAYLACIPFRRDSVGICFSLVFGL